MSKVQNKEMEEEKVVENATGLFKMVHKSGEKE